MSLSIISFPGEIDANLCNKDYLGGKGWSLIAMTGAGIPVPPGFIIPCHVSMDYHSAVDKAKFLEVQLSDAVKKWSALAAKGSLVPLVSVRSGAPISMPGMMDTILNVGINRANLNKWAKRIGERTAWDSYRRLIQMLGSTAFGIEHDKFEFQLASIKKAANVATDTELSVDDLILVVERFEKVFAANAGMGFPQTPDEQLYHAMKAVFQSWMNDRAVVYRKLNGISHTIGTAVIVQKMAFGNMNDKSGTGVLFTRNPATGEKGMYGEFLINAQGEDVVAGIRTPDPVAKMLDADDIMWPAIYAQLLELCEKLEAYYHDMVDIEFTVENGKLYCLQSRTGKRSAIAAFRIALGLLEDKVVADKASALKTIKASQYVMATRPYVDPAFKADPAFKGLPASPGVATGMACFDATTAVELAGKGYKVVLITHETTPDDIAGMNAAEGILTATGGATSHAAVVARAMDKPCVVGATGLIVKHPTHAEFNGLHIAAGEKVTICGATGRVWYTLDVPVIDGTNDDAVSTVVEWCRELSGTIPITLFPDGEECAMYLGDLWKHHTAQQLVDLFMKAKGHIRLDLRLTHDFHPVEEDREHDTALAFIFGNATPEQQFAVRVMELMETYASQLKDKITLVGIDPELDRHQDLLKAGYKTIKNAKTVKDLLGDEPVTVTSSDIAVMFGDVATFERTLAAFEIAGMQYSLARRDAHNETVVFSTLGA